jgi:hypothetical protein
MKYAANELSAQADFAKQSQGREAPGRSQKIIPRA